MKGQHFTEDDEFEFEFELLNSEDGKVITLVCSVSREIGPQEYAEALMAFAERIGTLLTMSEADSQGMN